MRNALFLKIIPDDVVDAKHEMGDTLTRIHLWSMRIHLLFILLIVCSLFIWVVSSNILSAVAVIVIIAIIRATIFFNTRYAYKAYCNQRNYEFLFFFTLLVPHLSGSSGAKTGLYRILMKLEARLRDDYDGQQSVLKHGINRLIIQMTNNPGNIEPFLEFAKTCSGTDLAEDVAIALYDFQQNSNEQDALIRLKEKVDRALQKRIEEIVNLKLSRFRWYSSRVVMSVFVLIIGILGTSIWAEIMRAFSLMQ